MDWLIILYIQPGFHSGDCARSRPYARTGSFPPTNIGTPNQLTTKYAEKQMKAGFENQRVVLVEE